MNASLNVSQPAMFVESRTWKVIQGMMTYGVLLLSLFGNSAALRVFKTPDVFNEARHVLLKGLTFCDLIFGMLVIIVSALRDATSVQIIVIETIVFKLPCIPMSCSVLHLMFIGIDRCIAIFVPLRYQQIVVRHGVIRLIVLARGYSTHTPL